MSNKSVQVGISWSFNIQVSSADIVKSFVINLVGDIGVFQQRVYTQDTVVWFDNSGGNLRTSPDGETNLRLLTIIDRKSFQH